MDVSLLGDWQFCETNEEENFTWDQIVTEYRLKQTPTDVWSIRERLCLASSVLRSGDQNWVSVSRAIRPFGEPNRPPDWFSQKNCALQYSDLLEKVETPKRKRGERGDIETPGGLIVRKLTIERVEELKKQIQDGQQRYKRYKRELELLKAGHLDDKLDDIWKQVQDEVRTKEIAEVEYQKWLKDREIQIAALRAARNPASALGKNKKLPVRPIGLSEFRRNSSQSEQSEQDSIVDSPLSVEVEDVSSPLPSAVTPHSESGSLMTPHTPGLGVSPGSCPPTPSTPPTSSTSLLTSLLKSPTPATPASSPGLGSIVSSPTGGPKEGMTASTLQGSPRSNAPTFFNPACALATAAARQLAVATNAVSSGSSSAGQLFSPARGDSSVNTTRSPGQSSSSQSATSSAPTLSKLLEMPPSLPGRLPSLPFFQNKEAIVTFSSPSAPQMAVSSSSSSSLLSDTPAAEPTASTPLSGTPTASPVIPKNVCPTTSTVENIPLSSAAATILANIQKFNSLPQQQPPPPPAVSSTVLVQELVSPKDIEDVIELKIEDLEAEIPLEEIILEQGLPEETEPVKTDKTKESADGNVVLAKIKEEQELQEEVMLEEIKIEPEEANDKEDKAIEPEEQEEVTPVQEEAVKEEPAEGLDIKESSSVPETPAEVASTEDKESDTGQSVSKEPSPEKETKGDDRDDEPLSNLATPSKQKARAGAKRGTNRKRGRPPRNIPAEDTEDKQETEKEEEPDTKDSSMSETLNSAPVSPAAESTSTAEEITTEEKDQFDIKLKEDKLLDDVRTPETPGADTDSKDGTSRHAESGGDETTGDSLKLKAPSSVSDSIPNSPASLLPNEDPESVRDYKAWKKAIMLVWRAAANHKYANVFLHPVTDEVAPGYHSIVYRPMDLLTIKKNIENGVIKSTIEFQRDMMLMFQNAIMYNSSDHDVYLMAIEMQKEALGHIQDFLATQLMVQTAETKSLRARERDAREKKSEGSKEEKEEEKKKRPGQSLASEEPAAKKRRTRTNE